MLLRFIADRRTLFWALVLFPALPTLAYIKPGLAPWLLPLSLYLSYCSGVLSHNHNHAPVFRQKRLNSLYSAWLSFFYGCPSFVWVPTHNQNHHRYLDGPGDATRTSEHAEVDSLWALLSYPTRSAIAQIPAIWRYARDARLHHLDRFRQIILETGTVVLGHAAAAGLALSLYGLAQGALLYSCALGGPALYAAWSMMFTNYLQHVGCDHASSDDHSRNFVSRWMNWLVFDAGYHTVHHEHAGTHWSSYPALHAARASRIAPQLNQSTILGYLVRRYLLSEQASRLEPTCAAAAPSETDCDTAENAELADNYG
ncbi:MAG TPA: fatty acid desaturase [Polyangiaceae bacterium]|nr:fatty acid desaturase [Polyangiaceae bacterium]